MSRDREQRLAAASGPAFDARKTLHNGLSPKVQGVQKKMAPRCTDLVRCGIECVPSVCVCVCVQRGYYERAESFVLIDIVRFDKMVFFDRMCGESLMNVIGMLILNAVRFMKMEC